MIERAAVGVNRGRVENRPGRVAVGVRVILGLLIGLLALPGQVRAAEAAALGEDQDWQVALRFFEGAAYDLAEQGLQRFLEKHAKSPRVGEGIVLLAEARYRQGKYEEAVALLRDRLPEARDREDQYRFWMAESLSRLRRYEEAVQEYAAVLGGFPGSARSMEAVLGQAFALRESGKAREAFDLLSRPDGVFLRLGAGRETEENVVRGFLLLGETALMCGQAAAGEALLERLPGGSISGPLGWRRVFLLARLQAALGKTQLAVTTATNLVGELESLTDTGAVGFRADARALAGEMLDRQGEAEAAIAMFEQNLVRGLSSGRRQEAAAQVARIALERLSEAAAVFQLERIVMRLAEDPVSAPLRLALAELGLRRYFGIPSEQRSGAVNVLGEVRRRAEPVAKEATGPWAVRGRWFLGWCAWEESRLGGGANRLEEATGYFEEAATSLPRSVEQAAARFKAGDCRYALSDYAAAVRHYWLAATNYADLTQVKRGLADEALYQVVRGSILLSDLEGASRAMELVLDWYPQSYFGDRSLLLYGQALGEGGRPAEARRLFTEYLRKFPSWSMAPRLGLAIARTWQQETNWAEAAGEYERWMRAHPTHPLRGQASYELAWTAHRAGQEDRAFQQFTNFVGEFPTNALAPSALFWVADHHYRRGQYDLAEREYQRVYQNTSWTANELKFRARLMAGRSAYRRTSYREARTYFTDLINLIGTNAPQDLLPEAYFALGDTIRAGADADRLLAAIRDEALVAYGKIPQNHPSSPLVPLAWGEIGNCHFQLGAAEPRHYDLAIAAYTNVLGAATADVAARSQAGVGIGMCLEKKAALPSTANRMVLMAEALEQYLRVTEGANLKEGEVAEVFWVERAGSGAAHLAEQLQRWDVAERLYERLIDRVPPMAAKYRVRLDRLRQLREGTLATGG